MRTSELVAQLLNLQATHGDLERGVSINGPVVQITIDAEEE